MLRLYCRANTAFTRAVTLILLAWKSSVGGGALALASIATIPILA